MKTFIIAETRCIPEGLQDMLNEVGAQDWQGDKTVSGGEYLIEVAGRMCYKSFGTELNKNLTRVREGNREYIANILKVKHGSVIEHASTTVGIIGCSRILTHELVRHRAGTAISQESQRFVRLDDFDIYIPNLDDPLRALVKAINPDLSNEQIKAEAESLAGEYLECIENVKATSIVNLQKITQYLDMGNVPFDIKKQITSALRRFIPGGVNTNIIFTANHRAWRHIIAMRTAPGAEIEIREVFCDIAQRFKARYPNLYQDMERVRDGNVISYVFANEKV